MAVLDWVRIPARVPLKMTKFGIVSDLHLEFRPHAVLDLQNMINGQDVDCVINAGDLHPSVDERSFFMRGIRHPHLFVMGNHDYYGSQLASDMWVDEIGVLNTVGCTLWTNFNNNDPLVEMTFRQYMYDSVAIKNSPFSSVSLASEMFCLHGIHLDFIKRQKPDVVVTHHSPSLQSIAPQFAHEFPGNYFFHSDLDKFILDNQNIKLWVHGHTHVGCDYYIGDTRIVCNPLGYPNERFLKDYRVKIVEL